MKQLTKRRMWNLVSSQDTLLTLKMIKESYLNNTFLEGNDPPVIKLDTISRNFQKLFKTQANLTIWNKIYKKVIIYLIRK